ncbi:MAG: SprT-like domain-containing protein [Rhodothermaceae bacterium]|nr:SprT-like domain-containing protein [Rhodothermaceae bacterium]
MSTTPSDAKIQRIEMFASEALNTHGLAQNGWSFRWDRAKRRFGCCDYTNKLISVSKHLALLNSYEQSQDTILHEIAHALAGRAAGHGPDWVAACQKVGARPERCYSTIEVQTPTAKYIRYCPSCKRGRPLHRKSTKKYACGNCCKKYNNGRYSEKFALVIMEREEYESRVN